MHSNPRGPESRQDLVPAGSCMLPCLGSDRAKAAPTLLTPSAAQRGWVTSLGRARLLPLGAHDVQCTEPSSPSPRALHKPSQSWS